ncbi:hypothetical protein MRX96_006119 [Rhipicephalus microplus]
MAHTIKVRMKVRWIRGPPVVLCSMRIMTTMGSDSDGASSLCSRTLTSPQPAIPGDRSERQRDLQDIDDGGDYSGDCAATVYDPCGANHFISDDDNTDFGSCDDTTDPTTMVQREAATTTLVSASEIFSVCAHMQVGPNIFISPVPSSFTM